MKNQNGSYLKHDGATGMKWGIRRWRNYDGTLTSEGKERYNYYTPKKAKSIEKSFYSKWDKNGRPGGKSKMVERAEGIKSVTSSIRSTIESSSMGVKRKDDPRKKSSQELQEALQKERLAKQYEETFNTYEKTTARKAVEASAMIADLAADYFNGGAKVISGLMSMKNEEIQKKYKEEIDDEVSRIINENIDLTVEDFINMDPELSKALKERYNQISDVTNAQKRYKEVTKK